MVPLRRVTDMRLRGAAGAGISIEPRQLRGTDNYVVTPESCQQCRQQLYFSSSLCERQLRARIGSGRQSGTAAAERGAAEARGKTAKARQGPLKLPAFPCRASNCQSENSSVQRPSPPGTDFRQWDRRTLSWMQKPRSRWRAVNRRSCAAPQIVRKAQVSTGIDERSRCSTDFHRFAFSGSFRGSHQ